MRNENLSNLGYKVSTFEELQKIAPSVFSDDHHPSRTDRYSFVSTKSLLHSFDNLGWKLSHAKQQGVGPYSRHIIRLQDDSTGFLNLKNDKVRPQIIVDNSHNGGSICQIHMGLFRLVCTNGLVVAMPGLFSSVKLKHMGIEDKKLKELLSITADHYKTVAQHISDMTNITLSNDDKEQFAINAYAHREGNRFYDEDGKIVMDELLKEVNPSELIVPLRDEDQSDDLWTVFNVVQERLLKGEFDKTMEKGNKIKARSLTNAVRNLEINKAMWEEAELILNENK